VRYIEHTGGGLLPRLFPNAGTVNTSAVFTWLDWVVLAGYFVGITGFGLWVSRRISSSGGYFLGDRRLPWWVMMGQAFGTGTHAENPVAQAGATFHKGFATIWYQWKNMLITPFYWLMAPGPPCCCRWPCTTPQTSGCGAI
jgi:hypothetical protein